MHGNGVTRKMLWGVLVLILNLNGALLAQSSSSAARASSGSDASPDVNPADLGVVFVNGSSSEIVLERNGKRYVVNADTHSIREANPDSATANPDSTDAKQAPSPAGGPSASSRDSAVADNSSPQSQEAAAPPTAKPPRTYKPGDDLIFTLPTGRRVDRHGLIVNFTHRFPFEAAFTGTGRGDTLLGLDDFAIPSFGFRFGVTSRLSVTAYRSPSYIGRPIELGVAYNFLDENDGNPFNAAVRFSIDGQNHFDTNFTENFELMVSRSLGHRAQLYAVPTFSIRQRPLLPNPNSLLQDPMPAQHCDAPLATGISPTFNVRPCANVFSLGGGASVDIRPTVALLAEAIPTLANGPELGIHRPAFAFGIQKKIWRHAFTFGFTNSPGTTTSQRSGTNGTFVQTPSSDIPSAMFVGFNISRQIF